MSVSCLLLDCVLADESKTFTRENLREIQFDPDDSTYMRSVETKYDLGSAILQQCLAQIIQEEMAGWEIQGVTILVKANGARGVLWAIGQLENSTTRTRSNLLTVLRFSQFREYIDLCIELMSDKSMVPLPRGREPLAIGQRQDRICDKARSSALYILRESKVLPAAMGRQCQYRAEDDYEVRDSKNGAFRAWWTSESASNQDIRKAFPSIVNKLLSPSTD